MASFTSRLAGWAAGRLGGEKSRKKTMEFVDKTGVGKLLSLAGDAALLGGAGKLAGMGAQAMGIGKAAQAAPGLKAMPEMGKAITQVGGQAPGMARAGLKAMPEMGRAITSVGQRAAEAIMPQAMERGVTAMAPSLTQRLGAAARGGMDYLKARPEIAATALTTTAAARQAAANRALDRQALAQRESQFQQEFGLRKGEQEREVERQRRIAEMLAPLFQRIAGGQG